VTTVTRCESSDRSLVSAGQCSPVPCRLLQVHNRCGQLPAPPLSKSPSAHRTTTSSHQLRPSGVYCCRTTAWNSLPDYLR